MYTKMGKFHAVKTLHYGDSTVMWQHCMISLIWQKTNVYYICMTLIGSDIEAETWLPFWRQHFQINFLV